MVVLLRAVRSPLPHHSHPFLISRCVDASVAIFIAFVQVSDQFRSINAVMLPKFFSECVVRVRPHAVIRGAQWPRLPIRTFLSKRSISQMRGFRRPAAADQAGQTSNPREIGAIALSPGVF
jgi:hypothetical protein